MIERAGRRAAEFVGTTVMKGSRAVTEAVNQQRKPQHQVLKVVVPLAGAAAAAAGVLATKARGLADGSGSKTTGSSGSRKKTTSSSAKPKSTAKSTAKKTTGAAKSAANGAAKVTEQTREELYELAKKADIPGRSQMTKDELAKALGK